MVRLFDNLSSPGWISFSSFFLWFALVFTEKNKILKTRMIYPAIFILPLLFIYIQWTGLLTTDYIQRPWGWESFLPDSILVYFYYLYYLSFIILGLYLILNLWRKTEEPIKKKQAIIIFTVALVSVAISTLTDIILPILDIHTLPSLANVFALIWASGIVYAIVKYKLMVITPVAAAENIISTMADSLILLDRQGNIVTVNKAALDLSGYGENELTGKPVEILFAEKAFKSTLLDKVMKKETIKNYELDFKTKTGDPIPVVFSSSAMMDEVGGMIGIVCIIKDITNRKKAEMATMHEQNLLHALMDNVPDFIYFKDEKNRFVRVNKKSAEDRDVRPEDFIGKTDFDIFTEEVAKKCFADDDRVMKTGKPLINKVEKVTYLNGMERWFTATKVPRYDVKGKIKGLIGISRDITERIQNEKLQQVLFNISKAANSPISLDELYQSIHQELSSIIDTSNFYIALVDQEEDKILFPYNVDSTKAIHLPRSVNYHSLVSEVIRTGTPLLVNQEMIKGSKTLIEFKEWFGTLRKIWLGVPLKVKERVIGAIVVQSYTNPDLYSEKDIGLLEFTSSQVATAIERKKAEDNLKKSQQEFDSLFRNSPEALAYLDEKAIILDANFRFCKLFGYTLEEIKGRNIKDGMIHSPDRMEEGEKLCMKGLEEGYLNYETIRKKKDGTLFPVSISATSWKIDGQAKGLIGLYIDITERIKLQKNLQESEQRLSFALKATNDGIWDSNLESGNLYLSDRYYEILGYHPGETTITQKGFEGLLHPDDKERVLQKIQECIEGKTEIYSEEVRLKTKSGRWKWILGRGKVVSRDSKGKSLRFVGTHTDISRRKEAEEKMEKLARIDSLTGCYNRGYGLELLDRQMKLSHRSKSPLLIAFLDIDKFKSINDTFGHDEGDKVLKGITGLFKSTLREIDIICRTGGDEFLFVFPDNSLKDAIQIKERLNKNLVELNQSLKKPYQIELSIGFSEYDPEKPLSMDELIHIADQKMYEEKERKNKRRL